VTLKLLAGEGEMWLNYKNIMDEWHSRFYTGCILRKQ